MVHVIGRKIFVVQEVHETHTGHVHRNRMERTHG